MATNYPLSQDNTTTLPNPTGILAMNAAPVTHSQLHDNVNDSIKALEAKLGYGLSTPAGASILLSNASNTTTWGNLTGDITSAGAQTTLTNTGVTPGTYSNANITVNSQGRIVVAANGVIGTSPLTSKGDIYVYSTSNDRLGVGADGTILTADSTKATGLAWVAVGGTGTVTSVAATNSQGVTTTVTNPTTTPSIAIGLGAITPTSVAATGTVAGSNLSGTNTGDQTTISGNAGTATKLATARNIQTNLASTVAASFDGSAAITPGVTGTLPVLNGGTGVTTKTGTGSVVLSLSPTLTTPAIGAATGASLNVTGQLTSTVATGTAPLAVTSTTAVTNLNADAVDGFNASSTPTANTILPLDGTATYPQSAVQGTTLGYNQITADFTTASTTIVQVTGLTATVTIPAGGRKVKITAYVSSPYVTGTVPAFVYIDIWDGAVGTGTEIASGNNTMATASANYPLGAVIAIASPAAGSKTYNVGMKVSSGATGHTASATTQPSFILVELI